MKKLFVLFSFLPLNNILFGQDVIALYNKAIPNSKTIANREKSVIDANGILRISKVSEPSITVYIPQKEKANGSAVIICPGGGYGILAALHEGSDVAKALNEWGVTAFVLKYRLPDDSTMLQKEIGPLQDAQRAIQLIRESAKKWNINKNKIGIMGFSAGGHLAATAGTHFSKTLIDNKQNTSLRPDFMILLYPVISFSDSLTHMGSRKNLLGNNTTEEKIKLYSNELQVTPQTPPTFLMHAKDDAGVKVQNSILFYDALQKNKVASEMHLYEKGGHGFGMHNKMDEQKWMDWLKVWMQKSGWVK